MQYDYLEPLVKDLSLYKIKTEINMKNLRICQTFSLWLVLLATSLSLSAQTTLLDKLGKITEITKTQPLESTEFVEKYVAYFTQPLDRSSACMVSASFPMWSVVLSHRTFPPK